MDTCSRVDNIYGINVFYVRLDLATNFLSVMIHVDVCNCCGQRLHYNSYLAQMLLRRYASTLLSRMICVLLGSTGLSTFCAYMNAHCQPVRHRVPCTQLYNGLILSLKSSSIPRIFHLSMVVGFIRVGARQVHSM